MSRAHSLVGRGERGSWRDKGLCFTEDERLNIAFDLDAISCRLLAFNHADLVLVALLIVNTWSKRLNFFSILNVGNKKILLGFPQMIVSLSGHALPQLRLFVQSFELTLDRNLLPLSISNASIDL